MAGRFWREAATLMVVGKLPKVRKSEALKSPYNQHIITEYDILFLKRSAASSFMPGAIVFPGGAIDKADLNPAWLSIFKKHGYSVEELVRHFRFPSNRLEIYTNKSPSDLIPELGFRICALRETFEETGLLLASGHKESVKSFSSVFPLETEELVKWRKLVHKDANEFMSLLKYLNACPSVLNLNEWSNWLTPSSYGNMMKRFDTMFYTAFIDSEIPLLDHDINEAEELQTMEPSELLRYFYEGKIVITPPQIYELHRILNFPHFDDFKAFSDERSSKGVNRWLPILVKTKDGRFTILPGDDLYPESPDLYGNDDKDLIVRLLEDPRRAANRVNRVEFKNHGIVVVKNIIQECGHVNPVC